MLYKALVDLISSTFTLKCIKLYGYSSVMHLIIFNFCNVTHYNMVAILGGGISSVDCFLGFHRRDKALEPSVVTF